MTRREMLDALIAMRKDLSRNTLQLMTMPLTDAELEQVLRYAQQDMVAEANEAEHYKQRFTLNAPIFEYLSPGRTKQILGSQRKHTQSLDVATLESILSDVTDQKGYEIVRISSGSFRRCMLSQHERPNQVERSHVLVRFHSSFWVILFQMVRRMVHRF